MDPCGLVTMPTQNLRVLFYEVSGQGLLKNAISINSEKSGKSTFKLNQKTDFMCMRVSLGYVYKCMNVNTGYESNS